MPDTPPMRRLAAILASDVVGYSRMMAADEAGTLAALKRHRETTFDPTVATHNGRIVKLIGDGALVEFGSVVDAVSCAMAVQRAIAESGEAAPKITLRIGINLGDVIIEGDDIYGDGVNIAARLEPLAPPGGVCISSIVNESIGSRIEVTFTDSGDALVKNIDRPIRIWKWHPTTGGPAPKAAAQPVTAPKPAASIAVLPFTNMSGDAEQEYFSDGISEDIITDLSKIAGLVVIARNSTFVYKGLSVDIRAVGRDLGVTSVLEGSIRRAGNRVRVTAQLIDAGSGAHLWADRYDRDLTDIFTVQDDVTREIVTALKVTLSPGEQARLHTDRSTDPEVLDATLKARELLTQPYAPGVFDKAEPLLRRAIAKDPRYGEAYAALALLHTFRFQNEWTKPSTDSLAAARGYVDTALDLIPDDAYPHYVAGITYALKGYRERAIDEFDRALALSPNFAAAINAKGVAEIFMGRSADAVPMIERAMRLDPVGSPQYLHFLGLAHLLIGNYETAAMLFDERIRLVPTTDLSRPFYAATLGHLGRVDEAHQVWRDLMAINPDYALDLHLSRLFHATEEEIRPIREGLAKAGLPPAA